MSIQTEQPKPPVSPEVQQLIDLCTAVAKGANDKLPALESMLQLAQQGLAPAWENFAKALEGASEEFVAARKPVIDAVEAGYQSYSQALDSISKFLTEQRPELLEQAATSLAQDWPNLYLAIMAYETSVLTVGPSKYGTVNLFDNLSKRVLSGVVTLDVFRNTCRGHQQFFQGVIKEIDASKETQSPGVPERRAAANTILELLKKLENLSPATASTEIEQTLGLMTNALMELETAYNTWNYHAFSETPTASPECNRVIHAAWGVRDGKFPHELLKGEAGEYQEHVKKSLETVHAATRLPAESTVLVEEIPKMIEAMESMDEALEVLKTHSENPAEFDAPIEQLKAAVERLHQSNEAVQKHNETYGKTLCPQCQTYNASTHKNCEKCGRQLPQFAGREVVGSTDRPRDVIVTRTMKELQDACEAYEKGKLSQEEFVNGLKVIEEKVRLAEFKLSQLKLPEIPEKATEEEREKCQEFIGFAADAVGLLAAGVGQCTAGLMKLEKYASDDQAADMREGLREFVEGCQKMLQIEQVARAFVAALPPKEEAAETGTPDAPADGPAATPAAPEDGPVA